MCFSSLSPNSFSRRIRFWLAAGTSERWEMMSKVHIFRFCFPTFTPTCIVYFTHSVLSRSEPFSVSRKAFQERFQLPLGCSQFILLFHSFFEIVSSSLHLKFWHSFTSGSFSAYLAPFCRHIWAIKKLNLVSVSVRFIHASLTCQSFVAEIFAYFYSAFFLCLFFIFWTLLLLYLYRFHLFIHILYISIVLFSVGLSI